MWRFVLLFLFVALGCRGEGGGGRSSPRFLSCKDGHAFFVKDAESGVLLRYKYTNPSLDNGTFTHTVVFQNEHLPPICWDSFGYDRCSITYIHVPGVNQTLVVAFPIVEGVALTHFSSISDSDNQLMYRNHSIVDFSHSNCQPLAVFDVREFVHDQPVISFCVDPDRPSLQMNEININSLTIIGGPQLELVELPSQLLWLDASDCNSIFFLDGYALIHWSVMSQNFGHEEDLGCEYSGRLEQFSDDEVVMYCTNSTSERSVVSDVCVGDQWTYFAATNGTVYPCSASGDDGMTSIMAFNGSIFFPSVDNLTISQPPGDIMECVHTSEDFILVSITPSHIHLTRVYVDDSSVQTVTINGSNPRLHDETLLSFVNDNSSSSVINLACDFMKPIVTINSTHDLALFIEGRNRHSCSCPSKPDPTPTNVVTLAPSSVLPSVTPSNVVPHNTLPSILAPIVAVIFFIVIFIVAVVLVLTFRRYSRKPATRQGAIGSESASETSLNEITTTAHTVSHEQSGHPSAVQNGGVVQPAYEVYATDQERFVVGGEEKSLPKPLQAADTPHNGQALVPNHSSQQLDQFP